MRAACNAPAGPPSSSAELLQRLDRTALAEVWAGHERAAQVVAVKGEHVDACRQRYAAFFDATEGQLDGGWAFEDSDCGYLLLNELLYGEETSKLGRLLVEDFKQYLAARKRSGERGLLIVDEFSAIADGEHVARMIEVVRSYGGAVVLAVQAYEGMGGEQAAARILNSSHTVFLHAIPDPELIVKTAGTRIAIESSYQHERGLSTDFGSARQQHQLRADPNDVRRLREGMCFVIGSGRAQRVQIAPRPALANRASRPRSSAPTDRPERPRAGGPDSAMNENGGNPLGRGLGEDSTRDPLAEPLLDAQAAAGLLSGRPSWIYEAVRAGRIPHLKIGRHIRFLRSDLEDWVVTKRIGESGTSRIRRPT